MENTPPSPRRAIERFHLGFLDLLGRRVEKRLFAVKGGCNLRFFFRSIRFSEDLDLDAWTVSPVTLQRQVNHVLASPPLLQSLRAEGLSLGAVTEAKQTTTTQRWKVRLVGRGEEIPTRIEFSRRGHDGEAVLEAVDPTVLRVHRLGSILAPHYGLQDAFRQKMSAMAGRREPQARDLFDLKLLLDQGARVPDVKAAREEARQAVAVARTISHEQFMGQVVPFLDPEWQEFWSAPRAWNDLRAAVLRALGGKEPS
ncbi:MAG: nucleotidyl transferase AbiEii/AbiGii toxin family protein [Verrucomicrobiia bacterium]